MAIKKQQFYEGAALCALVRANVISGVRYDSPFYVVNNEVATYLKYSTKGRSPWGFTFAPAEQAVIQGRAALLKVVIGLVCGADGVAALSYDAYRSIAPIGKAAIHIACYRKHGEHFAVSGPQGSLDKKIPPSYWQRILEL